MYNTKHASLYNHYGAPSCIAKQPRSKITAITLSHRLPSMLTATDSRNKHGHRLLVLVTD